MSAPFVVGAYGWDYAQWTPSFYPEDLPDDWRLTYYSRFFASVIIPANGLRELTKIRCSALIKDVGESFEFFLEIDPEWLAEEGFIASWITEIYTLKSRLSGFWVGADLQVSATQRQEVIKNLSILAECAPVYIAANSAFEALAAEIPGKIYPCATPKTAGVNSCSVMILDSTVPLDLRQLGKCLLEFYKQNQLANQKTILITGKPPEFRLLNQVQSLIALF